MMNRLFVASLTVFCLLAAMAYPCQAEQIYGCYQKDNGNLRIVNSPVACKRAELLISWHAGNAAGGCYENSFKRFVDCGNGTVTDQVTGLIFLKDANCLGKLTYADANNAAAKLESGQCGLTDESSPGSWRLPTPDEWLSAQFICGPNYPNIAGNGITSCFYGAPWAIMSAEAMDAMYWTSEYFWFPFGYPPPVPGETQPAPWAWQFAAGAAPLDAISERDGIIFAMSTKSTAYVWPVRKAK
jgi:hypothetical protein